MSVYCECCVLLGRGLCYKMTTRPEESYRLWCSAVCDLKTSWMRSQTSLTCDWTYNNRYHWMYLLHIINSDRQHFCWMSSDRLQCTGTKKSLALTFWHRNLTFKF
jgi:hypothetical protein